MRNLRRQSTLVASRRRASRRAPDTLRSNGNPERDASVRVHTVEAVKYDWPEWYTKAVTAEGKVWHWGPWKTEWAARQCARILAVQFSQRGQLTGGVHASS